MGGSTLPVGMVWNYIGGIGIELDRRSQVLVDTSVWVEYFRSGCPASTIFSHWRQLFFPIAFGQLGAGWGVNGGSP